MISLQIVETGDMLQGLTFSLQPNTDNTKIIIKLFVILFKNIYNFSLPTNSTFKTQHSTNSSTPPTFYNNQDLPFP